MNATGSPPWASVQPARVAAVQAMGVTARQARFLVHVLVFSGVFLERQYCRFAGIAHGPAEPRLPRPAHRPWLRDPDHPRISAPRSPIPRATQATEARPLASPTTGTASPLRWGG